MIDLLEAAAAADATQTAVITPEAAPTYGELLDDSRRVATALRRRGVTRFAVAEPDAAWVLRLLAGAALVGAEPCQYQPDTDARTLAEEAGALGHTTLVTRRADIGGGGGLEVIDPGALMDEEAGAADFGPADRPQPLVIRTTGTTGAPKAARHDWRVLTQTVAKVQPAPEQRWLLAYGPQQFAGIQVLLHVVASGATLIAPFPRQPKNGLDALLSDGVTCLSATPTFWRFLLAEARSRQVRLPSLDQITLGGEACPADLLDELRSTFPFARVSQVYASTEFGSITSVTDGLPGMSIGALWSASNPNSNVRAENGELWVRAEAGMLGYADGTDGDGPSDDRDFDGAAPSATAWRPTGDLVEIVGTRVLFRGRQSEIINVGGVKVHPLPVEERILALPSVDAARVFGRSSKLTGSIVAADIVPVGGVETADGDAIRRAVKEATADLPRAWQPRSITLVAELETRGGKTVRGTQA
ncbi:MAG TPA: class I adenylate-forming enzyme family protein [Acidimicrobiales bacterium]|jgi:acyl-CoA synthetase (AMP-forming)/AMP-acid ligase II|nr:class I adenylate-forming enzyme family protein [Acidimicrobiales bacterium]